MNKIMKQLVNMGLIVEPTKARKLKMGTRTITCTMIVIFNDLARFNEHHNILLVTGSKWISGYTVISEVTGIPIKCVDVWEHGTVIYERKEVA